MMQVYCWRCQNNFQLPFGAASIHCTICYAILDPRELLPSNGNRHDYLNEAAPSNGYCQDNRYVYAYGPSGYGDRNRYRSAPVLPPHSYGSGYADDNCHVYVPPAAPPYGSGYGFAPPLNGSGYGFAPSPSTNAAVSHLPSPCPPPGGPPPSPHGRKKAVICGISYKSSKYELEGTIPDAKLMKDLLISKFRYPEASIIMLTDEECEPNRTPTMQNIREALVWLVEGCQPGDSLVFYFSGHGTQQRNNSGDEVDGYDETICPLDHETQGKIVDDEINERIVKPIPRGVRLHAIIDACHSGTVLDLPFLCRMDRSGQYHWEDHRPPSGKWKGTNGGEVFSFSGCDDHQTSNETPELTKATPRGIMTHHFVEGIKSGYGDTYGSILHYMRSAIRNSGAPPPTGETKPNTMLVTQEPQLTAYERFNVYKKQLVL